MAFRFHLFIDELEANYRTYDPVGEQKQNSKDFACMKAIRLQSTSSNSSSCCRRSVGWCSTPLTGLQWTANVSEMIWSTTPSQPPLQDSKKLSKLSMHDTGNKKEKSPTKPELPDLLDQVQTEVWLLTSLTTSPAKGSSQSKQKNSNSGSTQGKGSILNRRSPPLPNLSSKLRKDGK